MAPESTTQVRADDVRALATNLRKCLRLYRRNGEVRALWRLLTILGESALRAGRDSDRGLPASVDTAVQGIGWAVNTGRVSSPIAKAIREMSAWDTCDLVAEVAFACEVQGQVPQYLIKRFASEIKSA